MTRLAFRGHGVSLAGSDAGQGAALLFEHGLGGSEAQVAESVPDLQGWRRLTLECRGHGASEPGASRPFTIAGFAEDALAFCDARGIGRVVAGGISMGAAIALHLAARHPGRVRGLILVRPAWLFAPAPANLRPYADVAAALRSASPEEARRRFAASATAALLEREAPDNLKSLLGFFDRPNPLLTADLLADIAADGPGVALAEARALTIPTLVIGHGIDHAHPLATAETLAATIRGATLVRVAPKATDTAAHVAAVRAAIAAFLETLPPEPAP